MRAKLHVIFFVYEVKDYYPYDFRTIEMKICPCLKIVTHQKCKLQSRSEYNSFWTYSKNFITKCLLICIFVFFNKKCFLIFLLCYLYKLSLSALEFRFFYKSHSRIMDISRNSFNPNIIFLFSD